MSKQMEHAEIIAFARDEYGRIAEDRIATLEVENAQLKDAGDALATTLKRHRGALEKAKTVLAETVDRLKIFLIRGDIEEGRDERITRVWLANTESALKSVRAVLAPTAAKGIK